MDNMSVGVAQQEMAAGGIASDEIDPRVAIDQVDVVMALLGFIQVDVEPAQQCIELCAGQRSRQRVQGDCHRGQ